MSNAGGVDNLTPFEYALAGVDVPHADGSPGLKAISHMRSLVSDMDDTPVIHPDLSKLFSTGGLIGRAERRDQKSRTGHAAAFNGGGFVDITPIELTDANSAEDTGHAAGTEDTADAADTADTEDTAVTEDADGFEALDILGLVDEDSAEPADQRQEEDGEEDRVEDRDQEESVALHGVAGGAILADRLFDYEGEDPGLPGAFGADPREVSGRFSDHAPLHADDAAFQPEPMLFDSDRDEGTAAFVAGTVATEQTAAITDADSRPMAVAAMTGIVPIRKGRFGTAFWALTGTAAAAAALTIGGLWWASSLNDDNDSRLASAGLGSEEAPGSPQAGVATDEGSSDGADSNGNSSTGSLSEDDSDGGLDVQPGSIDDSASSTATTNRSSGSAGSQTSTTTKPGTTEATTTAPPNTGATTTQPPTTEATTTEPPTTQAPTTQPPTTQPTTTKPPTTRPPTTQPPTTPAPRFASVGGTATVGSSNGPGLSGVQVQLYRDTDRDGIFEDLVNTVQTNSSGRYRFSGVTAACYAVNVTVPSSALRRPGSQELCVSGGDDIQGLTSVATVDQPDGCLIEGPKDNDGTRGVEVYENDAVLAEAYVFYDKNTRILTTKYGEPDDDDGPGDYEWFFDGDDDVDQKKVYFVAAQQFGQTSTPLRCDRA